MASRGAGIAALGAVLVALAAAGACERRPEIVEHGGGGGTSSAAGGHAGAATGGGGAAGSVSFGGGGHAPAPVYLGVTPTPAHVGSGAATAAERLEAALTVRAIGTRAVVLPVPWHDLDVAALGGAIDAAHGAGLRVVVELMLVDRWANALPAALAASHWDTPEVESALVAAIDAITARAPEVLLFGRELNRYLDAHPDEVTALHSLLGAACTRAAAATPPPLTGVGLGYAGESPASPSYALEALGSAVGFSFLPALGEPALVPVTAPAQALDVMLALAGGRPVVLERVGMGTSAALGGSEAQQAQFFDALFAALGPRRARLPYVNLHELADPPADACAAYLATQGEPVTSPLGEYLCSDGLESASGTPRAAWSEVVAAVAAFATP
ncbi:MAG: hypothetical protein IT373_03700 [Polyangiaceae bacterium]|nr:hypothetical protein [Polyangiaceae bacterium]